MLQFLNRRWIGVTGWVYLFSLLSAGTMFGLLPRSAAVAQLTLPGQLFIDGFTIDQKHLMIRQSVDPQISYYLLDLDSVSVTVESKPGYLMFIEPYQQAMVVTKQQKEYEVFIVTKTDGSADTGFERIPLGRFLSNLFPVGEGRSTFDLKAKATVDTNAEVYRISLNGAQAISSNSCWLLGTERSITLWKVIKDWYQKWQNPLLPIDGEEGYLYQTFLFDCVSKRKVATIQTAVRIPEYAISPQGDSFVVIEYLPHTAQSIITKYTLPLGTAYHSLPYWCIILATLGVPILWSMLLNRLRQRRQLQDAVAIDV